MNQSIVWRRLDRPGHESAQLSFRESRWTLRGKSVFLFGSAACAFDYAIVCDAQWTTLSTRISGWMGDQPVELDIVADAGRRWTLNGRLGATVTGSLDVDLGFSPSTNLIPIRRCQLNVGDSAEVRAAWLRFPELTLEPLEQTYTRLANDVYRYESGGGSFTADLRVNEHGLVTEYPEFFNLATS